MWQRILEWLFDRNNQVVLTAVVAVLVYILVSVIRRALMGKATDIEARHKIRRGMTWVGILFFVALALVIWGKQVGNLGVFLGIIGAGLALSMQETLLCMAGWVVIIIKKPFDIGDRIEISGHAGDIIDISLFHTSMLEVGNWVKADQSTGRMHVFPNSMVLRMGMHNYTKGFPFVWNEISSVVTFESDWRAAKEILLSQAQEEAEKIETEVSRQITEMQRQYAIRYEQLQPTVYTSIANHGIELTLRHLSAVRQRRSTTHRISEAMLEAFIEHPKIDFAYPTTRLFRNPEEGKPELRAQ